MSDRIPSYRRHRQSGQAIVTLVDDMGNRRDVLLGKYGTAAGRHEYARVISEWEVSGRRLPQSEATGHNLTISEMILAFWKFAKDAYKNSDGTPAKELNNFKDAFRTLRELYGHTAAREFGPLALKAVRQRMVESGRLCRTTINRRISRIRFVFKWAESEELVPASTLHALQCVAGLRQGRTSAREPEPVGPVSEAVVNETLPSMPAIVADMVQLQLLTGMRPGEVCVMRSLDIDMTGEVWLYTPGSDEGPFGRHKTAHHGHKRIVPIGPRGQEIIRKYLKTDIIAYLFDPRERMQARWTEQRMNRKTRVQPSQQNRRKRKPKWQPQEPLHDQHLRQSHRQGM